MMRNFPMWFALSSRRTLHKRATPCLGRWMAKLHAAKPLVAIVGLALLSAACAQPTAGARSPWLQTKISLHESLALSSPPRAILRTNYQGKTVYYVSPACCDIPSELYDEGGALLCFPEGGFAGGDGRCPTFVLPDNAATVWSDRRLATPRINAASPSK